VRSRAGTTVRAAVAAAITGALPSTALALLTHGNILESTNAVASMVGAETLAVAQRLLVAAAVHTAISLLWATVLVAALPQKRSLMWAAIAGVAIAVIDLKLIAPIAFPGVAALAFVPQLADHIVWAVTVAIVKARW